MSRAEELNERYNTCCDIIDTCCFEICMGLNVK